MISSRTSIDYDLFIGGAWTAGQTGGRIDVINPATEQRIGSVADASSEDAFSAIYAADEAMAPWSKVAPREKAEILRRCYDLMIAEAEDLTRLITMENGKALSDARGEVAYAAEFFRWYSEEAVRLHGEILRSPAGNNDILVMQQPVGVALLITPWNFPAAMATRKIAPALAAGCGCILKPATETPLTAYAIVDLMRRAGVPDGLVNVITTSRSGQMVAAMMDHTRLRKLSFTGSTQVGRILLEQAAKSIINCSMELGGNAPFVVLEDADIDDAVDGAMIAKMRNGGEACTAANRIIVQRPVAEEFSKKFAARMQDLKVGNGLDDRVELGPMINSTAIKDMGALVDEACELGATCLTGGQSIKGKGHFFAPTVMVDVPRFAKILREEIFGPVAPIIVVEDEHEAISVANDTEYGLVSYVYTSDLARALRVAAKIESGMVGLNRGLVSDAAAPFGGMKQSGLGREGSHHGIQEYLEIKYIAADWSAD